MDISSISAENDVFCLCFSIGDVVTSVNFLSGMVRIISDKVGVFVLYFGVDFGLIYVTLSSMLGL